MSTQPPLEKLLLTRLATVFADIQMEPIPEGQEMEAAAHVVLSSTRRGRSTG